MSLHVFSFPLRLLAIGIVLIIAGIYQVWPAFTSRADLIPVTGFLETSEIRQIESSSRRHPNAITPTLFFTLQGDNHVFRLTDESNFGFMGKEYDNLVRIVDTTATYTVYIDQDDEAELFPKVYQIDWEEKTILEFDTVRTSRLWWGIGFIIGGIGLIVWGMYLRR